MSFKSGDRLTVVVTRAQHQASGLSELLRARGARVIELPVIEVAEPLDWTPFDRALADIERYHAVLIGSKNAADAVAARGYTIPIPICVVGKKTLQHLASLGATFTGELLLSSVPRAEGMVETLERALERLDGKRILFLRAPEGRETAIELLTAKGASVDAVAAYRLIPAPPASEEAIASLHEADVFTFLSGETLSCFFEVVSEREARSLLEHAEVAVIGPIAKERADALGVRVDRMPLEPTAEALVATLTER
jgi:uroporphyrinogen-III synthase